MYIHVCVSVFVCACVRARVKTHTDGTKHRVETILTLDQGQMARNIELKRF